MDEKPSENENATPETQGDVKKNSLMKWAMITLALVILAMIFTVFVAPFIASSVFKKLNEPSNSSGAANVNN